MDVTELTSEALGQQIGALTARAQDLVTSIEGTSDAADTKAVHEDLQRLQMQVAPLYMEQQRRIQEESMKALTGQVSQLGEVIKQLQEGVRLPLFESGKADGEDLTYQDGKMSLFGDIMRASTQGGKSGKEAQARLDEFYGEKANEYVEGTDAAGGFLVRPEFLGYVPPRTRPFTLLDIIPEVRVRTDQIEFVKGTASETAGWSAELATKIQAANQTFASVTASIFTVAAYALSSNQLLEDSSVDVIIRDQLERGVRKVVETAILNGTGTGQPLGILGTSGVNSRPYTDASPTVGELLPVIATAITDVMDNHLSSPTHIVMRPQTWTKIITDASATGTFTFGAGVADPGARTASDPFPNRSLFGLPVILTAQMPSNLGAGTNETRIIVMDANEQLFLNRSDMEVALSEHVFFLANQTVFRGERRVGFTAGRYPQSITVISGTGLINTFA